MGHFVSSSREREKRDRRDSRGDERDGQGRKRNRNESEDHFLDGSRCVETKQEVANLTHLCRLDSSTSSLDRSISNKRGIWLAFIITKFYRKYIYSCT